MGDDNVSVVLDAYERGSRDEPGAWLEILDPDVVWDTTRAMPDTEVVHGVDEVRDFFRSWREVFEDADWEPRRTLAEGDTVVVEVRMHGRARQSGVVTDTIFGQLLTFRDGRIASYVVHPTFDEAVAAAGLAE